MFSIYSMKLKVLLYVVSLSPMVLLKYTVSLNVLVVLKNSNAVSFVLMGHRIHFWRRFPIKSWRPTRAKTARAKTVRIMTSTIFFTDWIKAPTMVFKPDGIQFICQWHISERQQQMLRNIANYLYSVKLCRLNLVPKQNKKSHLLSSRNSVIYSATYMYI